MTLNDAIESLGLSARSTSPKIISSVLAASYPREFEVYMIAFELTDGKDRTLEYLTFPINPQSINKTEPTLKSIKKTLRGIVINKVSDFVPQEIQIKGNFGRDWKILLNHGDLSGETFIAITNKRINTSIGDQILTNILKSGYGVSKVLQNIITEAEGTDNGLNRRLYFHNFAFGESYLIEVKDLIWDTSLQSNMMWNYILSATIVAPTNSIRNDSSEDFTARRMTGVLQSLSNKTIKVAKNIYGDLL